jgi:hypothetical protein
MSELLASLYPDVRWYLAYEILYMEADGDTENDDRLIWENLILIEAADPEEAYIKATKHGLDSEHEVTVNGRKGRCKFKGLRELIKIYEPLDDGAELEWREFEAKPLELESLVKAKGDLHAFKVIPSDETDTL